MQDAPAMKLVDAVAVDFPDASEILVPFADQWALVESLRRADDTPLYVAAWPRQTARPDPDHFYGLSHEVNRSLTAYRHYKLFQPWPQPILGVRLDENLRTRPAEPLPGEAVGRVTSVQRLDVRLHELGEAQAWTGDGVGLLWECYYGSRQRAPGWREELVAFWRAVERDMDAARVFTQPREPAFGDGYTDFLAALGYGPDGEFPTWWSKEMA
ncbi:MAG: hypothetical protein R2851_27895 [Caldilineaceae bacterium]